MAYGEQSIARTPVAYTIHVWPTQELVTQSWTWSDRWRAAYRQMAWAISLAAATQVLDGGTFARREIGLETDIGWVKFTISQVATTVHIVVSEFSGPNAPGPDDGGEAQPHAIDGLVIGLCSGTGGTFYVVVFHGRVPPIPCINRFYSDRSNETTYSVGHAQVDWQDISQGKDKYAGQANLVAWARALLREWRAHRTPDAIVVYGSSIESIANIDQIVEIRAVRESVGISRLVWLGIGCPSECVQEIHLGAAEPENTHRNNQEPRQSSLDYQLQ